MFCVHFAIQSLSPGGGFSIGSRDYVTCPLPGLTPWVEMPTSMSSHLLRLLMRAGLGGSLSEVSNYRKRKLARTSLRRASRNLVMTRVPPPSLPPPEARNSNPARHLREEVY